MIPPPPPPLHIPSATVSLETYSLNSFGKNKFTWFYQLS